MRNRVKLTPAQQKIARRVIAITFPEYRGRKVSIEFTETVTLSDLNWGGGTRNVFKAVRSDFSVKRIPAPAPWINIFEGAEVTLKDDLLMIEHSIFCGQDCGITIYAHPSYAPMFLTD